MSWSPYPSEPRQRRSTIVRDVLAVLALVFLAWLGRRVYRLVDDLRVVTEAVNGAGKLGPERVRCSSRRGVRDAGHR